GVSPFHLPVCLLGALRGEKTAGYVALTMATQGIPRQNDTPMGTEMPAANPGQHQPRNRRCSSRTCSSRPGTGPCTVSPGATSRIASARTADGGPPSSASHAVSCSDELTYTMRPSPTQAWAAAHMGQCSPGGYTVAPARPAAVMVAAAQRASSNSGCRVASPALFSRLRSSARTSPPAATSTEPNG